MKFAVILFCIAACFALGSQVPGRPVVYQALAAAEERQTILIEREIDWTPARIEQEIRAVFPDAPIMVAVAKCEGVKDGKLNATVCNPNTPDCGVFQLNAVHLPRLKALGLDRLDAADNIAFARMLYNEQGLKPWEASRSCWSK